MADCRDERTCCLADYHEHEGEPESPVELLVRECQPGKVGHHLQ